MTADMRPLVEATRLAGPAVTVRTLASDLAAAFKAIDLAAPGDIVVIDTHGSTSTAFWGENMTLSAINRGITGAVIDGACRDVVEIRRLGFRSCAEAWCPTSRISDTHVNVPAARAWLSRRATSSSLMRTVRVVPAIAGTRPFEDPAPARDRTRAAGLIRPARRSASSSISTGCSPAP
jgi:hypothetical protein